MPFVLVAFGAVAISPFLRPGADGGLLAIGSVATVLIALSAVLPWHRLPPWVEAAPPIAYYLVIALLRHSDGGTESGFAPLAYLPVIWLALYGTRRQMLAALAAMAVTFVAPIIAFGAPMYPETEWRRVTLALGVATLVGFTSQALVAAVRGAREAAEERAAEIARTASDLAASLAFERLLLASSAHMIVVMAPDGSIVEANPAASRLLASSTDELQGRRLVDLLDPDDALRLDELAAGVRDRETLFLRGDGRTVTTRLTVNKVRLPSGELKALLGLASDVTEEKRLLEALEEREATLASVLEASPDPIVMFDTATEVVSFRNSAASAGAGDPPGGSGLPFEGVHEQDVGRLRAAMAEAVDIGTATAQARIRGPDGGWLPFEYRIRRAGPPGSSRVVLVGRDVSDSLRLQEGLSNALAATESASRSKTAFLGGMSHELRTPLNSILGFGQLLQRSLPEGPARHQVDLIVAAGRHLQALIADLLDVAAIESGRIDLAIEPVDLSDVVAETVAMLDPDADRAGITLRVKGATRGRWVSADRRRLRQSLINLVGNAVKYNRRGGFVEITSSVRPDVVRLEIRDSAGGIDQDDLSRLFTTFGRLGDHRAAVEGTGLGLALTRGLVESMGGQIGVDTEPGVGSTFWVELRRTRRSARAGGRASADAVITSSGRPYVVVQIEDNRTNADLVKAVLAKRPQVRLLTADRGAEGIRLVHDAAPQLVLLDLGLPDVSGEQVLAQLRAADDTRETPVVIVSADASPGRAGELERAGASGYLTKPVDVARLLAIVDAVAPGARA